MTSIQKPVTSRDKEKEYYWIYVMSKDKDVVEKAREFWEKQEKRTLTQNW
jgi:hypothetical protein